MIVVDSTASDNERLVVEESSEKRKEKKPKERRKSRMSDSLIDPAQDENVVSSFKREKTKKIVEDAPASSKSKRGKADDRDNKETSKSGGVGKARRRASVDEDAISNNLLTESPAYRSPKKSLSRSDKFQLSSALSLKNLAEAADAPTRSPTKKEHSLARRRSRDDNFIQTPITDSNTQTKTPSKKGDTEKNRSSLDSHSLRSDGALVKSPRQRSSRRLLEDSDSDAYKSPKARKSGIRDREHQKKKDSAIPASSPLVDLTPKKEAKHSKAAAPGQIYLNDLAVDLAAKPKRASSPKRARGGSPFRRSKSSSEDDLSVKSDHERRSRSPLRRLSGLLTLGSGGGVSSRNSSPSPRAVSPSPVRRMRSAGLRERSQSFADLTSGIGSSSPKKSKNNKTKFIRRHSGSLETDDEAKKEPKSQRSTRKMSLHGDSSDTEKHGGKRAQPKRERSNIRSLAKTESDVSSDTDRLQPMMDDTEHTSGKVRQNSFIGKGVDGSKKSLKKQSSHRRMFGKEGNIVVPDEDSETAFAKKNRRISSEGSVDSSEDEAGENKRHAKPRKTRRVKSTDAGFESSGDEGGYDAFAEDEKQSKSQRKERPQSFLGSLTNRISGENDGQPECLRKDKSKYGCESSDDDEDEIAAKMRKWKTQKRRQRELASNDDDEAVYVDERSESPRRSRREAAAPGNSDVEASRTQQSGHPENADEDEDDDKTFCRGNKSKPKRGSKTLSEEPRTATIEEGAEIEITIKVKKKKNAQNDGTQGNSVFKLAVDPPAPKTIKAKTNPAAMKFQKYKTWTLPCLSDYIIRETKRSKFGGRLDYRVEATGFFRVDNVGGKWTFIDPEGCFFSSVGLNSVAPFNENEQHKAAFASEFSNAVDWANCTNSLLFKQLRFNTLGCYSQPAIFRKAGTNIPFCLQWDFMQNYCNRTRQGREKLSNGFIPCFDPEFATYCEEQARKLADSREDPWLLGHFSDTELFFEESGVIKRYLAQPEYDPGHQAALGWLSIHGKDVNAISREDDAGFCNTVISQYYRIVSTAIKKHDPNHLFLGSRFHDPALNQDSCFSACAQWVDVVSINYYNCWTPEQDTLNRWSALSNRPLLITEWSAKADDAVGCDNIAGSGFVVPTQKSRSSFYENFTIHLLRNPNVIGWHWSHYIDQDGSNRGILDINFQKYGPLADSMRVINSNLYSLSDYLLSDDSPSFLVEEDEN